MVLKIDTMKLDLLAPCHIEMAKHTILVSLIVVTRAMNWSYSVWTVELAISE